MEQIKLGRTGLEASVMGLGCGGHSRLGQATGRTRAESTALVRKALDIGINFIDTAEAYGTEEIVGEGIKGQSRDNLILSTKKSMQQNQELITAADLTEGLEASLRRLQTDYVDVYHLHAVRADHYGYVRDELVPALEKLRTQGKVRFFGITEMFGADPQHEMLQRAVEDDCWDVMMVGFNLLNQSARERIFPKTMAKDIGILIMFAVRRALHSRENFRLTIRSLHSQGLALPNRYSYRDIEELLLKKGGAESIQDAAYRFCRYEPGVHVTLSGTGSPEHLEANRQSLLRPPLREEAVEALQHIFAGIDSVSGN